MFPNTACVAAIWRPLLIFIPAFLDRNPVTAWKYSTPSVTTVAVIALAESQIEILREDEILCARVLAA